MTTFTVEVDGATLHGDDDGDGPVLLWGHGLTSSRFEEDTATLWDWRGAGHRVVRYDARGHGSSTGRADADDYRWPALSQDQLAVAHVRGLDRFVAGGASMGAATTLWTAVTAPERLAGLVLVIPPTAWETRAAQGDVYRASADLVERKGVGAMAAGTAKLPAPPVVTEVHPDAAARAGERVGRQHAALLPSILRGAGASDLPPPEAVAGFAGPVLVLAWVGDAGHPVSTAERLGALLPQADVQIAATAAELRTWPGRVAAALSTWA